MIKSKEELQKYYAKGHTWSEDIYSHTVIWRNWMLLLALLSIIVAIITLVSLIKLLPLKENTPYLVFIDHKNGEPISIKPVISNDFVKNEQLKKYMIRKFLVARERYQPNTLAEDDDIVSVLANDLVYKDYLTYLSRLDSNSMLDVRNVSISFLNEQRAYITFILLVNMGGVVKEFPASAQIKFHFAQNEMSFDEANTINPVNFEVLSYQSQINNEEVL